MNVTMLAQLIGKEAVARAKKRGRAYLCLACHHQKGGGGGEGGGRWGQW